MLYIAIFLFKVFTCLSKHVHVRLNMNLITHCNQKTLQQNPIIGFLSLLDRTQTLFATPPHCPQATDTQISWMPPTKFFPPQGYSVYLES